MKKILLVTALLFMSNAFATDDEDTFNQLKQLEGKWVGTINYSNRDAEPINLQYSIRSNGSALLEESNEGGTEMMTIFNLHNDNIIEKLILGSSQKTDDFLKIKSECNINKTSNFFANINKALIDLDWKPKNSIKEGLSKTLDNYI